MPLRTQPHFSLAPATSRAPSVELCAVLVVLLVLAVLTTAGCDLFGSGEEGDGPRLEDLPGKIVYTAEREDDDGNIYVTDHEGTRQLTNLDETSFVSGPAWSPDGERHVYSDGTGATTLGPYLKVMNADGSGERFLKEFEQESPQALYGWNSAWSPDGRWIAFDACANCELGGQDYEILLVQAAGEMHTEGDHYELTDHPASDRAPAWSPNGEQIAFISNRAWVGTDESLPLSWDLYVVNADGTGLKRLTETGDVGSFVWSSDGEWIATGYGREAFSLVNPESGATRRLPLALPEGLRAHPVDWALPDQLLLRAYKSYSSGQDRFYVLNIESGEMKEVLKSLGKISDAPDWFTDED